MPLSAGSGAKTALKMVIAGPAAATTTGCARLPSSLPAGPERRRPAHRPGATTRRCANRHSAISSAAREAATVALWAWISPSRPIGARACASAARSPSTLAWRRRMLRPETESTKAGFEIRTSRLGSCASPWPDPTCRPHQRRSPIRQIRFRLGDLRTDFAAALEIGPACFLPALVELREAVFVARRPVVRLVLREQQSTLRHYVAPRHRDSGQQFDCVGPTLTKSASA